LIPETFPKPVTQPERMNSATEHENRASGPGHSLPSLAEKRTQ